MLTNQERRPCDNVAVAVPAVIVLVVGALRGMARGFDFRLEAPDAD
jgi:hypothetical protein